MEWDTVLEGIENNGMERVLVSGIDAHATARNYA